MSRKIAPYGLRMAPDVKAGIEKAAQQSGRTLAMEINYRLRDSLRHRHQLDGAPRTHEPPPHTPTVEPIEGQERFENHAARRAQREAYADAMEGLPEDMQDTVLRLIQGFNEQE